MLQWSIFKMASAIAGLETGAVTRTETINDTGIYPKGYKPRCWYYTSYGRGHGPLNVSGAIKICNYYFYELITRMGIDNLEKYAKYFGLGEKTNVELPGETLNFSRKNIIWKIRANLVLWKLTISSNRTSRK